MTTGTPRTPRVSGRRTKPSLAPDVRHVDYKDTALLRTFISDRGKIRSRRVTGLTPQQQRMVVRAIKNAREMALLPYASRVTQTRGPKRGDGERGGRRERDRDLPAPETEPLGDTDALDTEYDGDVDEGAEELVSVDAGEATEGGEGEA